MNNTITLEYTTTSSPSVISTYTYTGNDNMFWLHMHISFTIMEQNLLTAKLIGNLYGDAGEGGLFENCSNLTNLDLSECTISNSNDVSNMFNSCSNLEEIICNDNWSVFQIPSTNMFYGCTNLVGAISYDSTKLDINYANPTTGYFTNTPAPTTNPIYFNGTQLEHIYFNGAEIDHLYFNGTQIM